MNPPPKKKKYITVLVPKYHDETEELNQNVSRNICSYIAGLPSEESSSCPLVELGWVVGPALVVSPYDCPLGPV